MSVQRPRGRRKNGASGGGRAPGAANASSPSSSPRSSKPSAPQGPESDGSGRSLELLAKVRSGALLGSMLAPADRQGLVVLLTSDGISAQEIAQILGVSDRSIERDRRAIREAAAVAKDPKLVAQMVGRLMGEAELSVQRIRRAVRDRDIDPAVKIDAEHRCFEIVRDLTQSLQRLGYLPSATQKLEADLTHHQGELPNVGDLNRELERPRAISDRDGATHPEIVGLGEVLARATLASRVGDLADTVRTLEGSQGGEP